MSDCCKKTEEMRKKRSNCYLDLIELMRDCYVTEFENADTSNSNIDFNGYKLYVNKVAIN